MNIPTIKLNQPVFIKLILIIILIVSLVFLFIFTSRKTSLKQAETQDSRSTYTVRNCYEGAKNKACTIDRFTLSYTSYALRVSTPFISPAPPRASYPSGTLIRKLGSADIYVLENQLLRWIPDIDTFRKQGYSFDQVVTLSSSQFSSYSTGTQLPSANVMRIVKTSTDPGIWEIMKNKKRKWIPNARMFKELGYGFSMVQVISDQELKSYKRIALVRVADNSKIYYITNRGQKHHIPSLAVFKSYSNSFKDVFIISQSELNQYRDSVLINVPGSSKVYFLQNGTKRLLSAVVLIGGSNDVADIVKVNETEMNFYPEGDPLN